jgi:hypothetical protein
MTEGEWLTCKRPDKMLVFVRTAMSQRKQRYFGFACCRRVWSFLSDPRCRTGLEAAEQHADELLQEDELMAIQQGVWAAGLDPAVQRHAAYAVCFAASGSAERCAHHAVALRGQFRASERSAQADLLRDVIGNPFQQVTVDPVWQSRPVLSLAHAAYDERTLPSGELDMARLAVLADAFEEAGCDNADILNHLRSPGPHLRGCWPLDLLTNRS